jgi:osmotically-inducible protein OsmY
MARLLRDMPQGGAMDHQTRPPERLPAEGSPNRNWPSYVPQGHGRTDEQIRADVHEVLLASEVSGRGNGLSITVDDGMVTLVGSMPSADARKRLVDRVRALEAVKEVKDELNVHSAR